MWLYQLCQFVISLFSFHCILVFFFMLFTQSRLKLRIFAVILAFVYCFIIFSFFYWEIWFDILLATYGIYIPSFVVWVLTYLLTLSIYAFIQIYLTENNDNNTSKIIKLKVHLCIAVIYIFSYLFGLLGYLYLPTQYPLRGFEEETPALINIAHQIILIVWFLYILYGLFEIYRLIHRSSNYQKYDKKVVLTRLLIGLNIVFTLIYVGKIFAYIFYALAS